MSESSYIFFWKPHETYGFCSQWAKSPFASTSASGEETRFPSAEHYMMYHKAILFEGPDSPVARQVMAITSTSGESLKTIKALGRKVRNFDEERWTEERRRIVFDGNMLKFRQNPDLLEKLLATGEKELVEASPRDRIWGIGFGAENAEKVENKRRWGMNLLGKVLVDVRAELRKEKERGDEWS